MSPSHGDSLHDYHAIAHKRSMASGFQIYLVVLIGIAVAAFLSTLASI